MKAFSLLLTAVVTLSFAEGANGQQQYAYLVSNVRQNEDWCITATNGVATDFHNLGFRKCDFAGSPANQLWRLDAEGKMHSALDDSKCMIVNYGTDVFDGVRVRVTTCATTGSNLGFTHNGATDQIKLASNQTFCLTNRGDDPNNSDTIHMKPCGTSGRFVFTYQAQGTTPTGPAPTPAPVVAPTGTDLPASDFSYVSTNGGCFNVRNSNPRNDEKTVLGPCTLPNQRWSYGDDGLIRTQLDSTKCMQAGRTATPQKGTKMRIFPCDVANAKQIFDLVVVDENSGEFKLQLSTTTLCIDHRGDSANIGADPIILKPCAQAGNLKLLA
jgi:hypothetical protein